MRIVAAIGGNALVQRHERPDADVQQHHILTAVEALSPLACDHDLVVTHGNGPQVGLLALESADDTSLTRPYPFDALVAMTQGMIGYWLLQALQNALPGREVATIVTQTLVSIADEAFGDPTKFVGPVYPEAEAHMRAAAAGWTVKADGDNWRRVVASPSPISIVETSLIRRLLDGGAVLVCAGGGGVPVVRDSHGALEGVEAVVDKDATSGLLAADLGADLLLLLTDVAAVETDYGTAQAQAIKRATPAQLRAHSFPAGSMGPKVAAVCRFVEVTGGAAAIGALADAQSILAGTAGTIVTADGTYP
jgi:carbamate kinase